jgi:hypothetical protein
MGDQGDAVRHQRGDAVARLQAEGEIVGGEAVGAILELAPGPAALERQNRRSVAAGLQAAPQQFVELHRPR